MCYQRLKSDENIPLCVMHGFDFVLTPVLHMVIETGLEDGSGHHGSASLILQPVLQVKVLGVTFCDVELASNIWFLAFKI